MRSNKVKYVDTKIVFREVPDEVTLAINISNCPVGCPGCHSSYLVQDIGEPLDEAALESLITSNPGLSCVSFMGGDAEPDTLVALAGFVRGRFPSLKVCWYSGRTLEYNSEWIGAFDYVKVGPYIDEYGPLDNPSTNQRFYRVIHEGADLRLEDLTSRFIKKYL